MRRCRKRLSTRAALSAIAIVASAVGCGSRTGFDDGPFPVGADAGVVVVGGDGAIEASTVACAPGDSPAVLVGDGNGIEQIVVANDTVYFRAKPPDESMGSLLAISSVSTKGGTISSVGISGSVEYFTTDGQEFFWAAYADRSRTVLRARSIAGGPIRELTQDVGSTVTTLFVDADNVYASVQGPRVPYGTVLRTTKLASANQAFQLDDGRSPRGPIVALDADAIYTFDLTELLRIPKIAGGSGSAVLNFGTGTVPSATTDGTNAAYSKWLGGVGEIRFVPNVGGNETLIATTTTQLNDVVLDGDVVYWFDASSLRKASKADAKVITLAEGLSQPHGLVVAGSCVYFQEGGRVIKRTPK